MKSTGYTALIVLAGLAAWLLGNLCFDFVLMCWVGGEPMHLVAFPLTLITFGCTALFVTVACEMMQPL